MIEKLVQLKYKLYRKLFPNFITSELYLEYLRIKGLNIGHGTVVFNPSNVTIDESRPCLISIGEYCKITQGVIILAHDYSRSVLRRSYGNVVGEAKKTIIGNNVFVGINSIILMGTEIGDNCIVGAGSVCTGMYPPNSVVAGNPAKVILTLDEYYNKRVNSYKDEAKHYAKCFKEAYGRLPTISDMGAFFPLFLERDENKLKMYDVFTNMSGDDEREIINCFLSSEPEYDTFESFLNDVFSIKGDQNHF